MTDEPLDRAVRAYRDERRSIPEIASDLGWTVSRVRRALLAVGVTLRTRVEGMTLAKRAGRGISPRSGRYERTPVILAKLSASRRAMFKDEDRRSNAAKD